MHSLNTILVQSGQQFKVATYWHNILTFQIIRIIQEESKLN